MPIKRVIRNIAVSNFAGAGFGFLVTVILARTLTVAEFGTACFIFSLVNVLASIADFGFGNAVVIYYNSSSNQDSALASSNSLYIRFLVLVVIISIPVLILIQHAYSLSRTEIIVVFLSFSSFSIYRYLLAIHQAMGAWRAFNLLLVGNNVLKFIVITFGVLLIGKWLEIYPLYPLLMASYAIYSVTLGAVAVAMTSSRLKAASPKNRQHDKDFLAILLPLGLSALLVVVSMRFDSFIIQRFLGPADLAIYSAANTLAFVFPLVTVSIMNVILKEAAAQGELILPRILAAQKRYLPLLVIVCGISYLGSEHLVQLLFGARYIPAVPVFQILLIPYLGGIYFTPLESYFYAREPRSILVLKSLQMLLVVLGSIVLIRYFSISGVAFAIALSRLTGWAFLGYKCRNNSMKQSIC